MELSYIKEFVQEIILNSDYISGGNIIDEETSLREHGFDSLGIVEIIVLIEEKYNFEFNNFDLAIDNFETISKIANLIYNKINE